MMRYTFPSGQFILLSSVIVIISTFFDCHEICKNPGLLDYRKLIFGDDSHEYSHYYYYFRTIRRNQPSPVVDETFVRLTADEKIPPKFLFKFYGTDVSELTMYSHGTIEMKATKGSGTIYTDLQKGGLHEHQILNKKELLAVRSIFHRNVDGKNVELKVLNLIHPSGKISIYYENVPMEIGENELKSTVYVRFECGGLKHSNIIVDGRWIKTKTLVEYEVAGDCPNHESIKACGDAKILNAKCMWCEHANMCITSNDKDTHKVDGCRKKSSIVDVSREPKPIEEEEETTPTVNEAGLRNELRQTTNNTETHLSSIVDVPGEPALIEKKEKTTPTINEADLRNELRQTTSNTETHLNVTTDTTDDEEQKKSRNYSYIIVPVIVTFIVVCSGCVIGLWFYRKKRSMP